MFVLWRLAKALIKLGLLLALAFVAFVTWGNFWPAPSHAPRIECRASAYNPCRRVSGRVLFHTSFTAGHRAHVVLMSRSSVTLPGITSAELPRLRREPPGFGVGDWVTLTGARAKAGHGEREFQVGAFATSKVEMRCGDPFESSPCRRVRLGGAAALVR